MRKVFVLVLVSLIVMLTMPLIFTNVALANATDAGYINITAEEAKQMIGENQNIVILDVRTLAEYNSGHIDGSKLMPLLELEERINAIDGNSSVIVYCGSGVKSEKASKILLDHGYDKVYNIMGGLNDWQDARFPVVSGSTANQITPSNDSLSSEIEEILNSGKPVFLFLYVDWCHFCQQQIPIIDELEQEYNGKITFIRVNCEMHPDAMKEFGVSGYPSMFLILSKGEDGQYESQFFRGFTDKETLKESIYWIIANGSINENSKDNELGIGASPMVLIDNEDYTVALAGTASRPSSPPGVAAYEQQSVFTCGSGSKLYDGMPCLWDHDCPYAGSGLPGNGDHCATNGNECIINVKWSCVGDAPTMCFVNWYMKKDCGELDVWECTPQEHAWHYKNYCKPGPACAIMNLDNIPCNDNDGWVCISATTREYRDYYCTADIPGSPLCSYPTPTQTESCGEDYWDCDGNDRVLWHCSCVGGSFYWKEIDRDPCQDKECVKLPGKDSTCEEVPEFPAGVTAVFGATLFIFLMMRRKYVRK